MPRYFFDVKNGHRLVHPAGLECRDDQEAIAEATVIAQQIARESEASEGRHVSVINGNGDEVGKVRGYSASYITRMTVSQQASVKKAG